MNDHGHELAAGDVDAVAVALAEHPFTNGLDVRHLRTLAEMSGEVVVEAGQLVFRHGHPAEALYLLTAGDVALEMARPGAQPLILQTLHAGEVLGWSWLYPPHTWHLDAHARSRTTALAVDARRLREELAADPVLGSVVSMRIGRVLVERLQHARDQLASVQLP